MRESLAEDPDVVTQRFYQNDAVVADYDEARFGSAGGRVLDTLQREAVRQAIGRNELQGISALDVGCGTGRFTGLLLEMGAMVTAVDSSSRMLAEVRRRYPAARLTLADARKLPFESSAFDLGVSVWVYNHMAAYEEAIGELCRVCREKVILGLPNAHSLYILPHILRRVRLWNGRYTVRSYPGVAPPTSTYFALEQVRAVLQREGFATVDVVTRALLPLVPNPLARVYPLFEQVAGRILRLNGSFMAVAARRKHSRPRTSSLMPGMAK